MKSLATAFKKWMLPTLVLVLIFSACQKQIDQPQVQDEVNAAAGKNEHGHLKQTKEYSSEVVFKWMDMQLRLMRTSVPFIGGLPAFRPIAYSGVALYESVVAGMPAYQTLSGQLTAMPAMPKTLPGFAYHWPSAANATLAAINRSFFPTTSAANKTAIDSLENALNAVYQTEVDAATFNRSKTLGKDIAQLIFAWSLTDGADHANDAYTWPTDPGSWVPTPPALAVPFGPYWKNNRLMVAGSLDGSAPPPPPSYSTTPGSGYYNMVKEVYDISQTLTPEQTAIGLYFRDNPGFGGGHYLSILKQVLQKEQPNLDISAFAWAKTGVGLVDGGIGCWTAKYQYNLERPITYIRNVLGHTTWNPLFATPAFPEYPSGHSTAAGVIAETLTELLGDNYEFTIHSYDFLGMAPRHYTSFYQMADEIGKSRVYAGIHNTAACVEGTKQGIRIAQNINSKLKFLKE
jgi:hypothetical protein